VTRRYGLWDDPWARFEGPLPGLVRSVGGTAQRNWLCVEAMLCRYRAGLTCATRSRAWATGRRRRGARAR